MGVDEGDRIQGMRIKGKTVVMYTGDDQCGGDIFLLLAIFSVK